MKFFNKILFKQNKPSFLLFSFLQYIPSINVYPRYLLINSSCLSSSTSRSYFVRTTATEYTKKLIVKTSPNTMQRTVLPLTIFLLPTSYSDYLLFIHYPMPNSIPRISYFRNIFRNNLFVSYVPPYLRQHQVSVRRYVPDVPSQPVSDDILSFLIPQP